MLGLPRSTELKKQLPKSAIYVKFQMNNAQRAKIDGDISRITIVNEVSAAQLNVAPGERIQAFFVLHAVLKRKNFDPNTVITLSKLIPQNMVLLLECQGEAKLAVYYTKLLQTEWCSLDSLSLTIKGMDLDTVWENVILQIGGIRLEAGNTLEQQIALEERRAKTRKEIERLEKLAWAEKQPKKKLELVQKINNLKQI